VAPGVRTPAYAQQSGVMRLVHQHAVTRSLLMACDEAILAEDLVVVGAVVDTDDQSHVFDRHWRVSEISCS
jgi:hypothetical protein